MNANHADWTALQQAPRHALPVGHRKPRGGGTSS